MKQRWNRGGTEGDSGIKEDNRDGGNAIQGEITDSLKGDTPFVSGRQEIGGEKVFLLSAADDCSACESTRQSRRGRDVYFLSFSSLPSTFIDFAFLCMYSLTEAIPSV